MIQIKDNKKRLTLKIKETHFLIENPCQLRDKNSLSTFTRWFTYKIKSQGKKKRQDSVPDDDDEDQNLLYYPSDDIDSEENIDLGQNEKLDQEKTIQSDPGEGGIAFFH